MPGVGRRILGEVDRRDVVVDRRQLRIQREDGEVVLESLGKQIRLVRGERLLQALLELLLLPAPSS